ncbi:GNAT family N-acetyltransferase [Lysinibacillus endophyticus]|uniref:GNAT family N-acetyltransferase n=1 Tax=Ureibacillus endophyticus TaxID=1978490 RepID=A0A494YVG3_9BACL|nr:GNAT family N-acetyltransferase [Lysinibacillus endophyticus]MCP1144231.1 GNAT family N-acetyltransferase [Lysinibacillus endophyticus]RKQ14081.1 GNAT family N-acetyltransferase [Lysinibacillus endophyticus]
MLIRYKKPLEKIAMGLLSLMPQEKDVKRLMETIQAYDQEDDWYLYLWKKDEEYIGIVGILDEGDTATIQHITVVPSYRGEGVAIAMLKELLKTSQFKTLKANDDTRPFIEKCLPILEEADA